jgi:light-regulated signal transduction histidine kinase (bacteriophytochrome)
MLKEEIQEKQANIVHELCKANVIPFQFRQLMQNLISNSLKYSVPEVKPHIVIKSVLINKSIVTI